MPLHDPSKSGFTLKANWNARLRDAAASNPVKGKSVLAAYNVVTDYVEFLSEEKILHALAASGLSAEQVLQASRDPPDEANTPLEFFAALVSGLRTGKAAEVKNSNPTFLAWLYTQFAGPDSRRLGGQAGIVASQLARLEAKSVLYAPLLSKSQADLFAPGVLYPIPDGKKIRLVPLRQAALPGVPPKVNWIFEFKGGLRVQVGGETLVAPRSNRLIVATKARTLPAFAPEYAAALPALGEDLDAAVLAGYQHLPQALGFDTKQVAEALRREASSLWLLKKRNSTAPLHFEYVTIGSEKIEKQLFETLTGPFDSLGCNEVELRAILEKLGCKREAHAIEREESAFTIYNGALKLMEKLKLKRVQVHNLGYFVVVLKKPYRVPPTSVLRTCLYASQTANARVELGREVTHPQVRANAAHASISDAGLNQVLNFSTKVIYDLKKSKAEFNAQKFLRDGIYEEKTHYALIIPAQISSKPHLTVGLGDVISSVALAAEARELHE